MTVGKLSIETFGEDNILAIINCDNGDHYEISGISCNHARHRAEDFCHANQIALEQVPHSEGCPLPGGYRFHDSFKPYRF